jgi:hypothetical protein
VAIKEITQRESLHLRGANVPPFLVSEYGWYATDGEHLSAVLFLDRTDKDYGFAVLGRDEDGIHRWIDGEHSFTTKGQAQDRLIAMLTKYQESGQTVFPQSNPNWQVPPN